VNISPGQPKSPAHEPCPGGQVPGETPRSRQPDEIPDQGPTGPRKPYPGNDPGAREPPAPKPKPDTPPDQPSNPVPRY
jgi:hypothetical protein